MSDIAIPDRMNEVETAKYLNLSRTTLPKWRSDGKGPAYTKLGGRIFYAKKDVDSWVASKRVDPSATANA